MLLAVDGATGVGRVGEDQAGGLLVNKTLQVLQVHFPGLLGLRGNRAYPPRHFFILFIFH